MSNLQVVLKVYAVLHREAFEYSIRGMKGKNSPYYMTDQGLEWLYDFFRGKSVDYCRMLFSNLFVRATPEWMNNIEEYPYLNNFKGITGDNPEHGTKQPAMITRTVRRCVRKYYFDSIKEARNQLRLWLTAYPIEEFHIYRIRTQKGTTFKEEIPLVPEKRASHNLGKTDWRNI